MTGFEPIIAQAVSGIAVPVFQALWGSGGKVLGLFGKKLDEKTKQAIFAASGQYAQNYIERHGILKVLGMRKPVNLESVYTAVQFLDDRAIRSFESVERLEQDYRQAKQRSFQPEDCQKQEGLKVANEKQYLMVLGGPGAGKSTFLRRMGLEALKGKKGKFKHACIPVFIELKKFNTGEINIEKEIAEEFGICGFPSASGFAAKALEQGKLLILLDGLDEVPTERMNEAIQQIQNFVDLHDQNRFITSCRGAVYYHNFRRFTDVAIAEFDHSQIEKFIANWFSDNPKMGQDCWQKLNKEEHKAAKELTQTPLLLTLLCLLYQHSGKFPNNRATLFERALRVLLEEWAAEKGIPHDELYKGLDTKRKEMMLSKIAHDAFQADRLFLPRREITEQIEQILKEMLPDEKFIDGVAVLKSMEVQHGILVERAESIYSFSHLTLQEYLTAQYIDDRRQIEQLVTEHLTDERWREVFLLVAGLMRGGADDLLLLMEKEAQNYINTPKLNAILHWTYEITKDTEVTIKSTAKRAIACAILCNCIKAYDIDKTIDSIISNSMNFSIDRIFTNTSKSPSNSQQALGKLDMDINDTIDSVINRAEISSVVRTSISSYNIAYTCAKKLDSNLNADSYDIALELAQAKATELALLIVNNQISQASVTASDINKDIKNISDRSSDIDEDILKTKAKVNELHTQIANKEGKLNRIQEKIAQAEKARLEARNLKDFNRAYIEELKIPPLEERARQISIEIKSLETLANKCEIEVNKEVISLNAKAININKELNRLKAQNREINTKIAILDSIANTLVKSTNRAVIQACNSAIENVHNLAELKFIRTSSLNQIIARLEAIKAKEINKNQVYTTESVLSKDIWLTHLNALALKEEILNVSEKEAEALKNYLYINCLILDCKKAAILVSQNTWKAIDARIFSCLID